MTLGILHTAESDPGTGNAVEAYLVRVGAEPHYVIDPSDGFFKQMVLSTSYAKALSNKPGGVETNRRPGGVIQVEIVGRAADCGSYDQAWYTKLRDQLAEISLAHSIAWTFRPDPTRLTFAEWDDPSLIGWLGHCHVPENDHWDPGTLDYALLAATPQETQTMLDISTVLTDGYTLNDHIIWTNDQANKILAAVQGLTPQAASIRSFPTAELLAELVRRQLA